VSRLYRPADVGLPLIAPSRGIDVWAKYTVRGSKLFRTNCVQAHVDCLEVLPHINRYLSTKQPRTIETPGHVNSQFFAILYFQELCLARQRYFSKNRQKIIKKKFAGLHPAFPPYGAAPPPPTKAGAKYLAAVVIAHHDRVLSIGFFLGLSRPNLIT